MSKTLSPLFRRAYERKKSEQPGTNLRSLAKTMGISAPFLSQLINGKRKITPQLFESFTRHLDLDREECDQVARHLLQASGLPNAPELLRSGPNRGAMAKGKWLAPSKDQFWVLREWYYLAILDSTLLPGYDGSTAFLAKKLRLPELTVKEAARRLQVAGFLEKRGGRLVKAAKLNHFSSGTSKEALRAYHAQGLERAAEELRVRISAGATERRLITTATVTTSKAKVLWAKQRVAEFVESLVVELSEETPEEVYQISIQLFPLTDED